MFRRTSLSLVLLVTAALRSDAGGTQTELVDGDFATACGPIACFVALRRIGCEANLESLAEQCGWSPGRTTSFRLVAETLSKHGVRVRPVRISAEQLGNSLVPRSRLPRIACRNFIDDEMAFAGILASSSLFAAASIRGWWRYFGWGYRCAEHRAAHKLVHQQ